MSRAPGHQWPPVGRRREQWDVASHDHHVEGASEVEDGHVPEVPVEVGGELAGSGHHRSVDIDAGDVDPAPGELAGHPSRATTGIEDGAGPECDHEVGLAVHVDTGSGQAVEALLVLLAGPLPAGADTAVRPAVAAHAHPVGGKSESCGTSTPASGSYPGSRDMGVSR